jgi:hypothetical protein
MLIKKVIIKIKVILLKKFYPSAMVLAETLVMLIDSGIRLFEINSEMQ